MNNKKKTSIGGQALIEGVMMRGPKRTVMAVRNVNGEIVTEEFGGAPIKEKYKVLGLPLIRGVAGFIESMLTGQKALMRSAEISGEDFEDELSPFEQKLANFFGDKLWSVMMAVAMVLGIALAFVLFIFLPSQLYTWLAVWLNIPEPASGELNILRSVFEGVLKIAIFVLYVFLCSRMSEIKKVFQYHGAEHKTIFCYENGLPLTVENVKTQSRFHPRCGTSFLILMLVLGIIVGMFIPPFHVSTLAVVNNLLRALCKIALLPLVMGIGYELLKLSGRYDNFLTVAIRTPGMWMQRLTTKEPDDKQIECAIASMLAVIPENSEEDNW